MSSKLKTVVQRIYFRPGNIMAEEPYVGGQLHGPRREWHRNGQLAEERIYRHGLVHGLCRQWNDAGKLLGSFPMVNGTGVQKSWHDNGRLHMEFSTVAGQFCGRGRTWLRDGTLVADEITLFNREVTAAQYRLAASTDVRLPKLRGRIDKPPADSPALEQRSYRLFVAWQLQKRNRVEAQSWLKAVDKKKHTLGRFKRVSVAVKFVGELYQSGAVKVIAPEVYHNRRGDQFADCLLVRLPKKAGQRQAIRAVCARFLKGRLGAVQPDQDWGETHVYVSMA
jgi:hypothetical protein